MFIVRQMLAAGTLPKTLMAVLATTEESLRSSMTEATLTGGGKEMRHSVLLNNFCHCTETTLQQNFNLELSVVSV